LRHPFQKSAYDDATRTFSLPFMLQTDGGQISCMIVSFLVLEQIYEVAKTGFPLMGGFEEDIVQAYQQYHQARTPICLEKYEMVTWAQWAQAANERSDDELEGETTPPSTPNDKENPDWEHIYLYDLPAGVWPERLLPLCDWGCGICTHIDASTEHVFQGAGGGQGYILRYVAASLEEWLERWLAGEALQFL
jgi:hypothetical protein